MNGACAVVHQSSSRRELRRLASSTASALLAVVDEFAPIWRTAESRRPSSHRVSSATGTTSCTKLLRRLRHLSPVPRSSQTTMSRSPSWFSAATMLDPTNPAPPVIRIKTGLPGASWHVCRPRGGSRNPTSHAKGGGRAVPRPVAAAPVGRNRFRSRPRSAWTNAVSLGKSPPR